jgi:heat shock protein beta
MPNKWNTQELYESAKEKMKWYIRCVFISVEFEELLPRYIEFLMGIVDSDSLPQNISLEIFFNNTTV